MKLLCREVFDELDVSLEELSIDGKCMPVFFFLFFFFALAFSLKEKLCT